MINSKVLKVLKALSDDTRLRIINILLEKELCVCEIETILKMSEPRISRHLKILKDANLVFCKKNGKWCYYNIDNKYNDILQMIKKYLKKEKLYISDLKKIDKINIVCKKT